MLPRDLYFQKHRWGCFQLFPILSFTRLSHHPITSALPHFGNDLLAKLVGQPHVHLGGEARTLPRERWEGDSLRKTLVPKGATHGGGCLL